MSLHGRLRILVPEEGVIGLLGVAIYSAAILVIGTTMVATSTANHRTSNRRITSTQTLYNAESGAEDALLQVKRDPSYGATATTLTTTFDNKDHVDTLVETVATQQCSAAKQVTASGYYSAQVRRIRLNNCPSPSVNADFVYALQAGTGGVTMSNNSTINGTVYSSGNVSGGNGARITGDAWVAGGAAVDPNPVFDPGSVADYPFGKVAATTDVAQSFAAPDADALIKVSVKVKKVGSPANATVRVVADNGNKPSTTTLASGALQTASVGTNYSFIDISMTPNPTLTPGNKYWVVIDAGTNATNYFSWASDNSYPNQEGKYSSNFGGGVWTAANTDFAFKIWTGGLPTSISNLTVGGDAHANTLNSLTVTRNAYYQTKNSTTVGGTSYPGSADPPQKDLPITDANIDDFQDQASAGGTYTGDYVVPLGGTATLGPKKIAGNLVLNNNSTLILTGTLWVTGTMNFSNNAVIKLDPDYGADSGAIVGDGTISISNNVSFLGSGTTNSFMLLATKSTSNSAIDVSNNASNIILAAPDGCINISNNGGANALTAKCLSLSNNATVNYVTGLADVNFSSGPGGSFQAFGWQEILLDQ